MEFKCYIAGTEYRVTNKYSIREVAGQPATSSIGVLVYDKPIPVSHAVVELWDETETTRIFTGFISSVDAPEYSTFYETDIYNLQVNHITSLFTRRLVSEAYQNKYVHEIVQDIFDNYLAEESLTVGTIETFTRQYENYIIPRLKVSDVFSEMCDETGAVAYISNDKKFYFMTKQNFMLINAPAHITKLKKAENGNALKTVQLVSGASEKTSQQTKSIVWATNQTTIELGYQVASEPSATINGNPVNFGVQGIDEGDISKTFMWRFGNNAISLNSNATTKPIAGDLVVVLFEGFYQIEVDATNEALKSTIAAISGTSGKIESVVVDTNIKNTQDGQNVAEGLLTENGVREESVTLVCHDLEASELLNTWRFNYNEKGIIGDYVVIERTIEDFYDKYKISVKLKNSRFNAQYGKVFNKNIKQINNLSIREDEVVIKTSTVSESTTSVDTWQLNNAGVIMYPSGSNLYEPENLPGFYPV